MPKENIIIISADANTLVHLPIKMERVVIISTEPIVFRPQPNAMDDIINKKDISMRLNDYDRIHLESKKQEIDHRTRIRFQNIYARVQSKQVKQLNIKKQKGR